MSARIPDTTRQNKTATNQTENRRKRTESEIHKSRSVMTCEILAPSILIDSEPVMVAYCSFFVIVNAAARRCWPAGFLFYNLTVPDFNKLLE